jgi:hypothetical protein
MHWALAMGVIVFIDWLNPEDPMTRQSKSINLALPLVVLLKATQRSPAQH